MTSGCQRLEVGVTPADFECVLPSTVAACLHVERGRRRPGIDSLASNYNTRNGYITGRELARIRVIAQTGCGIITNQGVHPDPKGECKSHSLKVAIFDDKLLPRFQQIAGNIRDGGAVGIQQILHAGRYRGIDLRYCVQPSGVPLTGDGPEARPRARTTSGLTPPRSRSRGA